MKNKNLFLTICFLAITTISFAQIQKVKKLLVSDTSGSIETSAAFEIEATDKAFLLPRVANTAAILVPVDGMLIYDISSTCVKSYNNDVWTGCLGTPAPTIASVVAASQNPASAETPSLADLTELGVTGLTETQQAYEVAIANASPAPTTLTELQAIIDGVNAIVAIVAASTDPAAGGTPSLADLTAVGVTGATGDQEAYEEAIANASPAPTTLAELQAIIDAVNIAQAASDVVLAQIGTEGDSPDTVNSVVTVAQLGDILPALTDLDVANETAYQDYIDANPNSFSSPATQAEVQAMVDAVNASQTILAQIGTEGDDPDTVSSVVTVAQLGTISPAVTGLDPTYETAYQDYIDANPNSFSSPATQAEVQAMVTAVNLAAPTYCTGSATTVVDVVGAGGATWMDRNLGATQVATSSTDTNSYGDLYQWGRFTDGHQCRTSATTSTNSATDTPGHGDFILEPSVPYDWLTTQDNTLWQGVSGTNNPCPSGYRLPTENELDTERAAWGSNNAAGAFASTLKLPVAGTRFNNNGAIGLVGAFGYYWTSSVDNNQAHNLYFGASGGGMIANPRAYGASVRCLKE